MGRRSKMNKRKHAMKGWQPSIIIFIMVQAKKKKRKAGGYSFLL